MASKNAQGSVWNRAAGDWEQIYEPQRVPLYEKILDACGVESGTRMLDAGCGSGGLSLRASLRGARVSGFDISEEMVARAQAKVTDGEYRVGELNAPPFDKGTFDTVIACECMFLAPDPVDAVRKLSRVCKSNGKVAIAVFGPADSSDQSRMFASMYAVIPEPPKIPASVHRRRSGVARSRFRRMRRRRDPPPPAPSSRGAWPRQRPGAAPAGPLRGR